MSDTPKIAQPNPYAVEVEAGKTYFWCSCGQSSKQPFCDGSHKGKSNRFVTDRTRAVISTR